MHEKARLDTKEFKPFCMVFSTKFSVEQPALQAELAGRW
jgi:hypothetical protein